MLKAWTDTKDPCYRATNWESPFVVKQVLKGGVYHLSDVDRVSHPRSINGQYLKKYYPTLWETTQLG